MTAERFKYDGVVRLSSMIGRHAFDAQIENFAQVAGLPEPRRLVSMRAEREACRAIILHCREIVQLIAVRETALTSDITLALVTDDETGAP